MIGSLAQDGSMELLRSFLRHRERDEHSAVGMGDRDRGTGRPVSHIGGGMDIDGPIFLSQIVFVSPLGPAS